MFVIEARPWTIVDVEIVEPLAAGGRLVGLQFLLELGVATPNLTQEQRIEQLRRGDDLVERQTVLRCQLRYVGGQRGRRKPCDLSRQFRIACVAFLSSQRGGE